MRKKPIFRFAGPIAILLTTSFIYLGCTKTSCPDPNTSLYNLDIVLFPIASKGGLDPKVGFIKFRQNPDTARIITLDTWVSGLAPHHAYQLQRAANPITDSTCISTTWLTLGKGLTPQSIHTDAKGEGHELLWRDVTAIARGTEFRIHFQIIDSVTQTPVLVSDCHTYEVR